MALTWRNRYERKPGRWVFEPTPESKAAGLQIKRRIETKWTPPAFYYHLRNGGHVAAVKGHLGSRYFFRADIEDFFSSVNRSRITRCLKKWFSYDQARSMANDSVVLRPGLFGYVLPYGFVQSPILASLALDMSKLGRFLRNLSLRPEFCVSVYVDDIIVSAENLDSLLEVSAQLRSVSAASSFLLCESKTEGPAETITVFNIEISHDSLRVADGRLDKFLQQYNENASWHSRAGIVSYVGSINTAQMRRFAA